MSDDAVTYMMTEPKWRDIAGLINSMAWMAGDLVVEIGTYHGETARFIAQVLGQRGIASVNVVSIDPFDKCPHPETPADMHGSFEEYRRNTAEFDQCIVIAAPSVQAAALIPKRIGILIVDGYHSYEACFADLSLYVPKVIPRGFVFVDDDDRGHPGVNAAISDYFKGSSNIKRNDSHAIIRIGDE